MPNDREKREERYRRLFRRCGGDNAVIGATRHLCLHDLYFLLAFAMGRADMRRDWLFERCIEVQQAPNGYLDLWAREHYKSTIITFGLSVQDILNDPEITIGIFSLSRPLAKDPLSQIKREFEENSLLYRCFPDVLWQKPKYEAPSWSLDNGITVKRKGNPREETVEAWGLVDSMPTGKHFKIRVYDDVIDEDNVTSAEMIKKATSKWELSLNLGSAAPNKRYDTVNIERYAGTRYHANDPYAELMRRGAATPRIYPGTVDGTVDGEPVLISRELMEQKRKAMGPYTFGCQILQDPKADQVEGFKEEWLQYYTQPAGKLSTTGMNLYLLCDPASEKKKDSDYTVMLVIGLGPDRNYYLIDGIRDRLNLAERAKHYIRFHRMYRPAKSGYEKYGKDSDIEHIESVMEQENYRFPIIPLGGQVAKNDRIKRLIPPFADNRVYLPIQLLFRDYEARARDLVREMIDEEYITFPVGAHDDILDCFARIKDSDLGAVFPEAYNKEDYEVETDYEVLD